MHALGVGGVNAAATSRLGGGSRTSRPEEPLFADVLGSVRASTGTLAGVLNTANQRVDASRREREVGRRLDAEPVEDRSSPAAEKADSADQAPRESSRRIEESEETGRTETTDDARIEVDQAAVEAPAGSRASSPTRTRESGPSGQGSAGQAALAAPPAAQVNTRQSGSTSGPAAGSNWNAWQGPASGSLSSGAITPASTAQAIVTATTTGAVQAAGQATAGSPGGNSSQAQGTGDFQALVAKLSGRSAKAEKTATADVRTPEGLAELARLVKTQLGQKRSSLTVNLSPAELGRVQVKVDIQDGVARVELTAETPEARDVLRKQLNELRGALEQQGIRVESLEVQLRPADQSANGRGTGAQTGEQAGGNAAQGGFGQADQTGGRSDGEGSRYTAGRQPNSGGEPQPVGLGSPWRLSETGVDLVA